MDKNILMLSSYPQGLKNAWRQCGYRVVEDKESIIDLEEKELVRKLLDIRENEENGYVFSFNFSPAVAKFCFQNKILYISWIVDSPHTSLWSKAAYYITNRIFIFDYLLWQELREAGNNVAYYLPLATDVELFQRIIRGENREDEQKFVTDVSFVGNLYDRPPHNMYDQIKYLPPYTAGYLEGLMKAQRQIWGSNIVHTSITDAVWQDLKKNVVLELENDYDERVYESFAESLIYKKITQLERKEVCSYLAKHFNFVLYSGSDTSYDKDIINRGYIDYVKEMPLVFHHSKININITLHGISTGIPLRVLDIMACGGFCLTNYQEEIATYFEDGVELVIYMDFEDMYKKIAYYLKHEEERKAIARAGYEKVKNQFDYNHGVGKIIAVLEGENE